MKTIILSAALALLAGAATADPLVFASGKAGGGYDTRSHQIAERLAQRGIQTTIENLNGSDEISLALCGGRAGIGILQIDAIYARSLEGCAMKPVAVYGTEYGVILFPPKSDKDELSDLGASDAVLVDTIGSGSELFWNTIVKIEKGEDGSNDEWAQARPVNDPLELAMASAEMGDIDAVVIVRKLDSQDITRFLSAGWTLGYLYDKDINDLTMNGESLYPAEKVRVNYDRTYARNWAYAVRSFVAVTPSVASGDRKEFAAITSAAQ